MSNEDLKTPWPDVPRIAFGSDGSRLAANVGWVQNSRGMYGYVEGYAWAARALYNEAASYTKRAEFVIFPLAFLWRQHLELAIKWVIALGRESEGKGWKTPVGHDLVKLWEEARPFIEPMGGSDPNDQTLANVEATLREFQAIDPGGDGWRYPVARDGTSRSMANVPSTVSLPQLQEAMEALSTFFDCVQTQLHHEQDMRSEFAQVLAQAEWEAEQEHGKDFPF